NTETTAMGAAFFAGLGVGVWSDAAALGSLWAEDRRFEPAISAGEAASRLAAWHEAVGRARSC
ncbi:MAG: glycerol kinase, partial [Planctomycetota bacterium]